MLQKSRELKYAVIAMVFITVAYLVVQARLKEIPSASSLWGHSIGVLGFVLMLMTEVLYSLRKRSMHARWGRMSDWLEFHIFTGLVGPFLVLLHPGFPVQGTGRRSQSVDDFDRHQRFHWPIHLYSGAAHG